METRKKNALIASSMVLILFVGYLILSPKQVYDPAHMVTLQGETMGTYYSIKYLDEGKRNFQASIDSLLIDFNQSLSTYIEDSEISIFNKNDTLQVVLPYFLPVLQKSVEIWEETEGAFDPTVMPLVNAWGFGPEGRQKPDSITLDSIRQLVGLEKVMYDTSKIWKTKKNVQLDFSAIAKGYGVDVVANYLITRGIENLMVEIGGEVYCQGKNSRGEYWVIGIDNPASEGMEDYLKARISLKNKAVATSGNYRNFYTEQGKTYAHTISPYTGYPIQKEILSASVFANLCIEADAFATAFMVMGLKKAKKILKNNSSIDAYLIFRNENDSLETYYTPGIAEFIKQE